MCTHTQSDDGDIIFITPTTTPDTGVAGELCSWNSGSKFPFHVVVFITSKLIVPVLLPSVMSTLCCKRLQTEKEEMCGSFEEATASLKAQHEEELVQLENRYWPGGRKLSSAHNFADPGFKGHLFSVSD